jgi:folate-dependent tRNA-U54 methylase TrmFO/GidA
MDNLPQRIRKKTERYGKIAERALAIVQECKAGL